MKKKIGTRLPHLPNYKISKNGSEHLTTFNNLKQIQNF